MAVRPDASGSRVRERRVIVLHQDQCNGSRLQRQERQAHGPGEWISVAEMMRNLYFTGVPVVALVPLWRGQGEEEKKRMVTAPHIRHSYGGSEAWCMSGESRQRKTNEENIDYCIFVRFFMFF